MKSNKLIPYLLVLACLPVFLQAQRPKKNVLPSIPVGLDAYRQWDKLPLQRIGVRAYMRSTYERGGGGYDASNFLFMNKEDENVTLDVKGRGILYFFRTNHWHGSPWHFIVDGKDNIVKETATADPVDAVKKFKETKFIPADIFPEPLAWTWGTTKGADLIWTPMSFTDSLQIAYSRTFYGTGYYIYHLYANEQPSIKTWNLGKKPDPDVVAFVSRAGTDIAPQKIKAVRGEMKLDKESILLADIEAASSVIKAVKLTLPLDKAIDLERIRLRITWDHAKYPSVDAPICLFFGAGTFYNREKKEYLVKGLPINTRYDYANNKVELACYYPMPFFKGAKFELTNITTGTGKINFEIRYERAKIAPAASSYFHATYVDIPEPVTGQDMVWLDTRGVEGHANWSGSFLGTSFIFSHDAELHTLEGDPRFFFDDSQSPQAYGTGTEEWAGGGDYWGGENMTLPLAGHPCGSTEKKTAVNEKDLIQSAYRFLVADLMPFGSRAVIRFEHSENVSREHYEAVTYWYGLPARSLIKTDSIDIGNAGDERVHGYHSPDASEVSTIVSRYEWGADKYPGGAWGYDLAKRPGYKELMGKEIYPAHAQDGRHTTTTSEFTINMDPANLGVLLRRTLDYSFPNQTAAVYLSPVDTKTNQATGTWQYAGTWYLAGSNTWMESRPSGELAQRKTTVRTSNRQFRDDEFLLPAKLTKGLSTIRVQIRFIPNNQPLYPGRAFPKQSAWSELKYDVFSYVLPNFTINDL